MIINGQGRLLLIMSAAFLSLRGPCGRGRRRRRLPPLSPPATMPGCLSCARPVSRMRVTGRTFVDAVYPSQTHFPAAIGHTN